MLTRVKIDGHSARYDLDRVRYPSQLDKGDHVMIRRPRSRELVVGTVFSVIQDCVTIEYQGRGPDPEYTMIYSRKLWDKVLKLTEVEGKQRWRKSKYAARPVS